VDEELLYKIVEKARKYDQLAKLNRDFEVHCSFCGKSQSSVKKIITRDDQNSVAICNECIELCNEIIEDEKEEKETTT